MDLAGCPESAPCHLWRVRALRRAGCAFRDPCLVLGFGGERVGFCNRRTCLRPAVRQRTTDRAAWACISAGLACYGTGTVVFYGVLNQMDPVPYPSVSDGLWLMMYRWRSAPEPDPNDHASHRLRTSYRIAECSTAHRSAGSITPMLSARLPPADVGQGNRVADRQDLPRTDWPHESA